MNNTNNKYITVIIKDIHNNQPFIKEIEPNKLKQCMPGYFCGNITEQLYNSWEFNGELIHNIQTIEDVVSKIKI